MNAKILTSVGCLLLLAAAFTPAVLGHSERPIFAGDLGSGYAGAGTGNANSVSGRYVGAAGPAVAVEAYANPQDTLASGGMLCDAEVVFDSNTAPDGLVNEENVDGVATIGLQDNFWDDGGSGGACHTHHYSTAGFNTFGCQAGARAAGSTHAGTDIWVGASCDWKEVQGGQQGEVTLVLCVVNSLLALNVGNLVGDVLVLVQCVVDYVNCLVSSLTNPTASCVVGGTEICGADGSSDAIVYGYAGVGATLAPAHFPANGGINNGVPQTCPAGADTAGIFVWDTVATNFGSVEVYLGLTGELWTAPGITPAPLPVCTAAGLAVNGGVAGQSKACLGTCSAAFVTTVAEKTGGPLVGTITTTVELCANGAVVDPTAGDGPVVATWPTAGAVFICTVHASPGTIGSGNCF